MQERRSEVRLLCADVAEVFWKYRNGVERRVTALLEDISRSGACLQLEMPVPVGVKIRWRCRRREFSGRVCYCVYRDIGYLVGVQFLPPCRWSRRLYHPRHLLDVARLGKQPMR